MKSETSQAIQAKTTLCQRGLNCLSGSLENICRVRELIVGEVLLIECAAKLLCKYNESFGSWAICTCPTRKEIYNRLGV